MSERFYVLPYISIPPSGVRGPKYIPINMPGYAVYTGEPSLRPNSGVSLQPYGLEDVCFMAYNSAVETQHATLNGLPDVDQFPANLDNTLGGALATVQARMEVWNIPANWLVAGSTWRELARTILGIFHFGQRFANLGMTRLYPPGVTLQTEYGSLPVDYKAAFDATVADRGLDTTGLTGTTTMRQILRQIGQQQAPEPFFGVLI